MSNARSGPGTIYLRTSQYDGGGEALVGKSKHSNEESGGSNFFAALL